MFSSQSGRRKRKRKQKKSFADYIVFLSIAAVSIFTIAAFVLQFRGYIEVSSTLTTCWFAFWGTEIIALAAIKTSKIKNKYDEKKEEEDNEPKG